MIIHAVLPNDVKATGTWNFDLGGKIYTVKGSEDVTYTDTIMAQQTKIVEDTATTFKSIEDKIMLMINTIEIVTTQIEQIDSNIEGSANMIESISATTEQTSASAEEVSSLTEQQVANMQSIKTTVEELSDISYNLEDIIKKFKTE